MSIRLSQEKQPQQTPHLAVPTECATVLREHPAVRDAVACQVSGPNGVRLVTFVLADDHYIDGVLGRKEAASSRVRKWRQIYDLTQLAKPAAASPFAFNVAGWRSSYTRQPFPPEDMREWIQTTVDRISALAPTEVLEIGCGTGLLLLRLAPTCQRYVALDFAPSVLKRLREQLAQTEDLGEKVEVLERSADDFEGFAENSFSTVIVNSVAQHFPSQVYLNQVLENAIRVVRPGGCVFIGDQRNLVLLEAYAASIEVFQATGEATVAEIRTRIRRRIQQEQQLVLSPSYFLSLKEHFPKISRIEIYPRRGNRDNEMTRFRFDAILWLGTESTPVAEVRLLDPPRGGWKLDAMRLLLSSAKSETIGFAHVFNSRVARDIQLLSQLATADPEQMIGQLHNELLKLETQGIHPEQICQLAAETGYAAAISWAGCYSDGAYDAAFLRQGGGQDGIFPSVKWPQLQPAAVVYRTNAPGQSEIRQELVQELLSHCSARLPSKLVPASVYLVDSFPRQADGSLDCEALLFATQAISGR